MRSSRNIIVFLGVLRDATGAGPVASLMADGGDDGSKPSRRHRRRVLRTSRLKRLCVGLVGFEPTRNQL